MESFALPLCAGTSLFLATIMAAKRDRAAAIGFVGLGMIFAVASMFLAASQ